MKLAILYAVLFLAAQTARAADDILIADFEGANYGSWTVEGTAFGGAPAHGTLPGQMNVEGFAGKGLANSFNGGDAATGKLTSPEFKIERPNLSFLIGGGGYEKTTCMNLLVDGKIVRTATGPNTQPGGSESLAPMAWDVSEFSGKTAKIEIVDAATGGWGHINVDQIVLTDRKPAALSRQIEITQKLLHFPVKTGGAKRQVKVLDGDKVVRFFEIELADKDPQWWAPLDVSAWKGKTLTIAVNRLGEDSQALTSIEQSDTLKNSDDLYREKLRPQFHFSAQRGWLNDPNGLSFFNGEYHLFFQHNPYGYEWGNMHWGHAVSKDLVHWQEVAEALYPDAMGPMFSGSAVVDRDNTLGAKDAKLPQHVLIYTAAGNPSVQCIATSSDGRNYTKFSGNPVIKQITGGNRDPKVIWHAPTKKWVLTFYVGHGNPKRDTIHFFSSPNLTDWTEMSQVDGFFECPDFFELPVDGNAANSKWVLTAANSMYMLGSFDGTTFKPETPKLPGHVGRGFYAAQTFSDEPKGRRVQIGWFQAPSPGMAFNQAMTVPLELSLKTTPSGPRLAWQPVKKLEALRKTSHAVKIGALKAGDANPLAEIKAELVEIRAEFEVGSAEEIGFNVRGVPIVYDAKRQEISVNGHRASAPLQNGKQRIIIMLDRTTAEVFASDGLTYVPMPVIAKAENVGLEVFVKGGEAKFDGLNVYELESAWK